MENTMEIIENNENNENNDIKFRQSNNFIESRFSDFKLIELKVIEYLASQTKRTDISYINDKMNKIVTIRLVDLSKLLDLHVEYMYQEANHIVEKLFVKYAQFKYQDANGNIDYELLHFIERVRYENGVFTFEINHEVLHYFVNIKKDYTDINLKYIAALDSIYAIKMYKLLKQYQGIKKREFNIEELKTQLGIVDSYSKYSNFKKKVIDVFVNKINENTDIYVEYVEIRTGKSVKSLMFKIN